MPNSYIDKILRSHVYDVAIESPLQKMPLLSKKLHNKIYLKREDLQSVFSFKLRGAYNKIALLTKSQAKKGVIAASAGNHAQGVALAAKKRGINALIVMPITTPPIKVNAVQNLGAKAVLYGDTYDEAYQHALELEKTHKMTFIHPYDDPDVIAGQGTVGMEITKQMQGPIHAVFVPVGGGGLIAGIAAYIKYVHPHVKIIGVEPDDAACLHQALKAKKRVELKEVGIFADGVAVKIIGKEPFRLAKLCVDDVITVSADEICAAIKDIYDNMRAIAEPAGALSVAGIKKYCHNNSISSQNLIGILSGANVNFDRLQHIAERAEIGEHKEALFAVTIPEQPGSFKEFCKALKKRGITEFNYRYTDSKCAHVFCGIALQRGHEEREEIIANLKQKGYPILDLTDNEMAKLHLRHMIGGKSNQVQNERIFRFQFPERPGALLNFLEKMGGLWNISLFHYRNHGAAYGRVLVGIQVPKKENTQFTAFLKSLGYSYKEETDNASYRLFLQNTPC